MSGIDELLDIQAKQMRLEFAEASAKFKNTVDVGKRRELIVSDFIGNYLPPDFGVGNGEIIDQSGARSGQVDVVVRNQFHPISRRTKTEPDLFYAEGVFCALETKSNLDKAELERGISQIRAIKKLKKNLPDGATVLAHSKYDLQMMEKIHCVLFAFSSPSIPTLRSNMNEIHERDSVGSDEQVDLVVALDQGLVLNRKDPSDSREIITVAGKPVGLIGIEDTEGKILQRFLWFLSSYPEIMTAGRPLISGYLKFLQTKNVKVFADKSQ